jgi:hypothetical protein
MSKKAVASLIEEQVASSSSDESSNVLSIPDRRTGRRVLLALVNGGKLQLPKELRAQIMRPLKFFKFHKCFFAHHRRQQALPPLGPVVAECSPCGRVRLMLPCVAFACQRLATAPAGMPHRSWSWAEVVMERVTRGRVRRVQVRLQRRACSAVRCACRATACVLCAFDASCRKRWLVCRCVASHRNGRITRAVAFYICVQAAAAARVAGGRGILKSAENGDGVSVLCHVIADADAVNKRDRG